MNSNREKVRKNWGRGADRGRRVSRVEIYGNDSSRGFNHATPIYANGAGGNMAMPLKGNQRKFDGPPSRSFDDPVSAIYPWKGGEGGLTTTKKSRRFFFIPRDPARVRFVAFDNKNLVQLPQTRSPIVAGARTSARNCLRLDSTRLDSAKVGTRTLLNNIFHSRGRNACNKREYQALTLRLHGVFFLLPPFFSLFLFF